MPISQIESSGSSSSSSSGILIGDPISGGNPNDILYVDVSGNLGQIDKFTYDGSNVDITDKNFRVISGTLGDIFQVQPSSGFVGTRLNTLDDGSGNVAFQGGMGLGNQYSNPVDVGQILAGNVNSRGYLLDWNPMTDHGALPPYYWKGNLDIQGDSSQQSGNTNFVGLSLDDINPGSAGVFMQFNMFDGSVTGTQTSFSIFGCRPGGYALAGGGTGLRVEQGGGDVGSLLSSGISDTIQADGIIVIGDWEHLWDGTILRIDSISNYVEISSQLNVDGPLSCDFGEITTDGGGNLFYNNSTPSSPAIFNGSQILGSGSYSGNTTKVVTNTGTNTSGDFLVWDSNGNAIDGGGKIYAPFASDFTGQVAAQPAVVSVTSPNDSAKHQYSIGGYLAITAISAGTVTFQITYTDETSTAKTANLFPMGLTSASLTATGAFQFPNTLIRVNPNTAIKLITTFTGVSVTYDVGGFIQRIN